jgi:hypothetical protein
MFFQQSSTRQKPKGFTCPLTMSSNRRLQTTIAHDNGRDDRVFCPDRLSADGGSCPSLSGPAHPDKCHGLLCLQPRFLLIPLQERTPKRGTSVIGGRPFSGGGGSFFWAISSFSTPGDARFNFDECNIHCYLSGLTEQVQN